MDNAQIVSKVVKSISTEKENLHLDVPVGHVRIIEVLIYPANDAPAKKVFAEDYEQSLTVMQNNVGARFESYSICLPRKTAVEYLNRPENRLEFVKR